MSRRRKTRSAGVPGLPGLANAVAAWRKNADGSLTEYIGESITSLTDILDSGIVLGVYGYTFAWEGTSRANLASNITLPGDFKLEFPFATTDATKAQRVLYEGTSWAAIQLGGGACQIFIGGAVVYFTNVTQPVTNGPIKLCTFTRVGNQGTMTLGASSETKTVSTAPFLIRSIGIAGSQIWGTVPWVKVYDASNNLIHHWICESSPATVQTKIYDVIGGRNGTLNPVPSAAKFTTKQRGSALLARGYKITGNEYIPAGYDATGLDSIPGILTVTSPVVIEADPNATLVALDSALVLVDSGGTPKAVAPSVLLSANGPDIWGGGGSDRYEIAMYSPQPSAALATKISRYFARRYL